MDSTKVYKLLMKIIDPSKCFVVGVFPRDLLKIEYFTKFPACCIANIDDSTRPGQHWVAFYVNSPNDYEFFDSYGLHPSHYDFESNWSFPTLHNTHSFQSDYSSSCGHFCLYYLNSKSLGFSMSNIVHSFSSFNLHWNDKLVRKFVSQISNSRTYYPNPFVESHSSQVSILRKFVNRV